MFKLFEWFLERSIRKKIELNQQDEDKEMHDSKKNERKKPLYNRCFY